MKRENVLGLIIAYYMSRFDLEAYRNLGFDSRTEGHRIAGKILGVKPNTIKNMRDEFDSIHDNGRVGWYQRELRPSRQIVVEAFQELDQASIHDLAVEILSKDTKGLPGALEDIVSDVMGEDEQNKSEDTAYIVRGPTGKKAEEYFIDYHRKTGLPLKGDLKDTRELGCGYDFEIQSVDAVGFVEVKGLKSEVGGMLFTSKEWEVARKERENYYVAFVRNLSDEPVLELIKDPYTNLEPQKRIRKTVQVRWQVSRHEIENYLSN